MNTPLPDAEALIGALARRLEGRIGADTGVVGIVTGGAWLAARLHAALGVRVPLGELDISFYRDDFDRSGLHHQVRPSKIPFDVQDRPLLLVDDVLYTGRTVRAAMNELFDYGRPSRIDLAVLVDRGGRELPVAAQYAGTALEIPAAQVLVLERDDAGRLSLHVTEGHRERRREAET